MNTWRDRIKLPSWLPRTGWSRHSKGYLIYTGRSLRAGIKRGTYAHRIVLERLGCDLTGKSVHHQDWDKLNNLPANLLVVELALNPSPMYRCPWTGRFLSRAEYERRMAA